MQGGNYEEALKKFTTALQFLGYNPHLSYNVALCYYRLKEYALALKFICEYFLMLYIFPYNENIQEKVTMQWFDEIQLITNWLIL